MPTHDPDPASGALRLRPGVRVSRRGDDQLQVGLHADDRLVVPDSPDVRRLLRDLGHGVRTTVVPPALATVLDGLLRRGLVVPPGQPEQRRRARATARVGVLAGESDRAAAVRALAAAGLQVAGRRGRPAVVLLVTTGAEPRRDTLDRWMREDRPHLLVTSLGGRTRLGPLVVPGRTACQRCVDEHHTDLDPRHPLVLEQHHDPDPRDAVPPADLQLALAWAARDLGRWVDGDRPATWSATVELGEVPRVQPWRRHPRCGCAWGDALAG